MTKLRNQQWRFLPIEDCMEAIIDYRGKSPRKTTYGIPLVTAKIVKNGRIDPPSEFIDIADYDTWMRRGIPQPSDVVMTTEAPLGEIAQLDERKVALAQRLITLRGKEGLLDNTCLKFAMQSIFVQEQLRSRATGTTVIGIRQSELRKVRIPIPPFFEQCRIADILGSLDEKMELNRKTNEILETMARAIFKSWFVDFDPVHAKAAIRSEHPKWSNEKVSRVSSSQSGTRNCRVVPGYFRGFGLGADTGGVATRFVRQAFRSNERTQLQREVPRATRWNAPSQSELRLRGWCLLGQRHLAKKPQDLVVIVPPPIRHLVHSGLSGAVQLQA